MKQFNVPGVYRSELISTIKTSRKKADKLKKDFTPTLLDFGPVQFYLARHFGFCYGVENAIEIAFDTIENNPGKRFFLLSEMIHNPSVNRDLKARGVQFLQDTNGKQIIPFEELQSDDIVIIPAFGTTREIERKLNERGIHTETYNTTCPFVEKVWNRSNQISQKGYSIIVHGKPKHEETRATFSHASLYAPTVVVNNMRETVELGKYITGEKPSGQFYEEFEGRYSPGFDVEKDLERIGVVNQTTQLATDTQAISDYLKQVIKLHFNLSDETIHERFADTRDTLCYATLENQSSVKGLLEIKADFAIIVGGYNSSNTSHLVELCQETLPSYFIDSASKILSPKDIHHCNWKTKEEMITYNFLPNHRPVKILLTSGASCPDALVEEVILKIAGFFNIEVNLEKIKEKFQ